MFKIIITMLMLLFIFSNHLFAWDNAKDKSRAYQKGFKEGYQYQPNGGIKPIAPIAPIAPIPNIGQDADDMYIRGVVDGKKKRSQ